jgi:integrase
MDSNVSKTRIAGFWNKGRLVGQKLQLKLREIWAIRIRLQLAERWRDLALFNLAIDSKLRGCDLVSLRVKDISQGRSIFHRAIVMQRKTSRPVQFEITEQTRQSVLAWIDRQKLSGSQYLFPSRVNDSPTPIDPPVRTHRYQVGGIDRPGCDGLRDTFDATNKSHSHLPANEKSSSSSVASWAY